MTTPAALLVMNLSKKYGDFAMADISFEVEKGTIAAMLGPSGAGKTTLLRLIAGLETPDTGDIFWDGQSLMRLPPHRRQFGLMVQDYALFPHMTVSENVGFGVRMAGADKPETQARTREMLKLVGLERQADRSIASLSGGEQQRVALARSLAPRPRLLMLDEPLGSLDRSLRDRLLVELPQMLTEVQQTAIYVTHDQDEAFAVAQQLILLKEGRIEQVGSPEALYRSPGSAFTARFLGLNNIFRRTPTRQNGVYVVETPLGLLQTASGSDDVEILVRPEAFRTGNSGPQMIEVEVRSRVFRGELLIVGVRVEQNLLKLIFRSSEDIPAPGKMMTLSYDPETTLQILP